MQINSQDSKKILKTVQESINNKILDKTTKTEDNEKDLYAKKEAAPANAQLYKAMYGVKEKSAEDKFAEKVAAIVERMNKDKTPDEETLAYQKAMVEQLLKWGSLDKIKEVLGEYFAEGTLEVENEKAATEAPKEATTSTPVNQLPDAEEVEFASEEDKKYYEQYLEFKHKYE